MDSYDHLIFNKRERWNYRFIKNCQEILLDLADFALQEQPEDNFNGRSYAHAMAA